MADFLSVQKEHEKENMKRFDSSYLANNEVILFKFGIWTTEGKGQFHN